MSLEAPRRVSERNGREACDGKISLMEEDNAISKFEKNRMWSPMRRKQPSTYTETRYRQATSTQVSTLDCSQCHAHRNASVLRTTATGDSLYDLNSA